LPTSFRQMQELAKTKLEMPVLALGGEISFGDGVKKSLEQVASDVRGGTIAGSAHWIAEEQPEALLEKLFAFFEEQGAI